MANRNLLIIVVVAVLIILAAGFFYIQNNNTNPSDNSTGVPTEQPTTTAPQGEASPTPMTSPSQEEAQGETTVTITQSGFESATTTISPGASITWTNESGTGATVSSDAHPSHTLWPFINSNVLKDSETHTVMFDEAGTYTYHDHLKPSSKGTVVVK